MRSPSAGYPSLLLVVLFAVAAYAGVDAALGRLSPAPPRITEVDDGVDAYQAGDPEILVLGSSHARSFEPLRDLLADPKNGGHRVVVVPAEWGTFMAYRWALEHRLGPLIDERVGSRRVRGSLQRALLITTFYDMCKVSSANVSNLPARVWTASHFLDDLLVNGLNDYNRNFLQTRWRRLWGDSILAPNRGYQRVENALLQGMRRVDPAAQRARAIASSRALMERQDAWCDDDDQKRELRRMVEFLLERDVEVTVVLFALMPAIVSDVSRRTTLQHYADHVAALARELPIRVVDLTSSTPMGDPDFQADFDHLTPAANRAFSAWVLDHDLAFLKSARTGGRRP